MTESDFVAAIPTWLKYLASAGGGMGAALLFLRQWLSQAKVDRTANDANVATILRLQAERDAERERADAMMREREAMVAELGELRGKVETLSEQVETLTALVRDIRGHV